MSVTEPNVRQTDMTDQYVGRAGKSVVDYVIASQCLFSVIDVFEDHDTNILSDHCILHILVTLHDTVSNAESEISSDSSLKYKYYGITMRLGPIRIQYSPVIYRDLCYAILLVDSLRVLKHHND